MKFKQIAFSTIFVLATPALFTNCSRSGSTVTNSKPAAAKKDTVKKKPVDTVATTPISYAPINHAKYDSLMKKLAHGD
ncbi:MAG TPA: hypothetical protein VHS53_04260, partial [Mucilaginibacter sp.]|nr:hypothetical protein [Mucilaginibacter sp.]